VFGRTTTRVNQIEVEDCVAISMAMEDGSLGTISVTLGSLAEISRHRFTFRNVTAESNTEPYANSREPWVFSFNPAGNEKQIKDALEQLTLVPERYAGQFHHFYQALRDGAELPVTLRDARAALEIIAATYYSSDANMPVDLPIGPGHPRSPIRSHEYLWPLIVINNQQNYTLQLSLANLVGTNTVERGTLLAYATMAMVPVLVVFLCFQRYFVKGSLAGSVKG
jgi:hypothetical protein